MAQIYDFDDFNYDAYNSEAYDIKEIGGVSSLQEGSANKSKRFGRQTRPFTENHSEVRERRHRSIHHGACLPLSGSECSAFLPDRPRQHAERLFRVCRRDGLPVMLEKVSELKFDIGVEKPPKSMDWKCSLSFNGNGTDAKHNSALCLLLEQWRDQKDKLARGKITEKEYADWKDQTISYCSYERISQPENQVSLFSDKFSEEQQTALRELLDKYEERKKSLLETEAKLKELRNRDLRGGSD